MSDYLVKRLRGLPLQEQGALCEEAADRIEELEKALRPFSGLGEALLPVDDNDDSIWVLCPDETPIDDVSNYGLTFGVFRNAARVLKKGEER